MRLKDLLIGLFDTFEADYGTIGDYFEELAKHEYEKVEKVIRSHQAFSENLPSIDTLVKELEESGYSDYRKLYHATYLNDCKGLPIPPEVLLAKEKLGPRGLHWTHQNEEKLDIELRKIFKHTLKYGVHLDYPIPCVEQPIQGPRLNLKMVTFEQVVQDYKRSEN